MTKTQTTWTPTSTVTYTNDDDDDSIHAFVNYIVKHPLEIDDEEIELDLCPYVGSISFLLSNSIHVYATPNYTEGLDDPTRQGIGIAIVDLEIDDLIVNDYVDVKWTGDLSKDLHTYQTRVVEFLRDHAHLL